MSITLNTEERTVDCMMMWQHLREIQDMMEESNLFDIGDDGTIGYDLPNGKHHLFIYVDDSIEGKVVVIEPNIIVDGAHEPCGEPEIVPIDYPEELLVAVAYVIETQCMED